MQSLIHIYPLNKLWLTRVLQTSDKVQFLKDMRTFTEHLGDRKDIKKGSLLSSKAFFSDGVYVQKVQSSISGWRGYTEEYT
jgi:hypothetical protein